ncbi:MAG: nucleotidyl transferase AbiEii/AbiGii toxin family protein [Bacilli bacterium]|nr:nucleotidyl transferase AbiEii/AbiGii toxin family protein [Bacilli bacterium]
MKLADIVKRYQDEGYPRLMAESKACQDVILRNISRSGYKDKVAVKGGVVMQSLSHSKRRATRDLDFDFIHYPLTKRTILDFLDEISDDEFSIFGKEEDIEELQQQDYHGLRVYADIQDSTGARLRIKLDVGVHKHLKAKQTEYIFDIDSFEGGVSLLVNTPEQIFTEKLKSLLRHGFRSTRYKDVFDLYFLISNHRLKKKNLKGLIKEFIFDDPEMRENTIAEIADRVSRTFQNSEYAKKIGGAKAAWLDVEPNDAMKGLLVYFESLQH